MSHVCLGRGKAFYFIFWTFTVENKNRRKLSINILLGEQHNITKLISLSIQRESIQNDADFKWEREARSQLNLSKYLNDVLYVIYIVMIFAYEEPARLVHRSVPKCGFGEKNYSRALFSQISLFHSTNGITKFICRTFLWFIPFPAWVNRRRG